VIQLEYYFIPIIRKKTLKEQCTFWLVFVSLTLFIIFLGKKFAMKTTHSSQSNNFSPINSLKKKLHTFSINFQNILSETKMCQNAHCA